MSDRYTRGKMFSVTHWGDANQATVILSLSPRATVTGVVTSGCDFTAARAASASPKDGQAETSSCCRTCPSPRERAAAAPPALALGGSRLL